MKKKRHTIKAQVAVDKASRKILATAFAEGSCHDFKWFKTSDFKRAASVEYVCDSGDWGIQKLHAKSRMPRKSRKLHPLTAEDKRYNTALAKERILNEHVIRYLKRFRVLSERYRNRPKRFSLRFNLIAAIYNLQHT